MSMMTFRSATVRAVILAVATTFSWSLWASCAEAAMPAMGAQMACCKDGEFTCVPQGNATDCCLTNAVGPHSTVANAKVDPVHTLRAVIAWAGLPEPVDIDAAHNGLSQPASPPDRPSGPPPYIAFSSLLI